MNCLLRLSSILFSIALISTTALAQYSLESFSAMKWRLVGPHRAGRVTCVAGITGKPAIYYFGTPGGGVWKTTNGGRVWKPIFDDAHVASIGALALAPSNPDIIYVGTGEETVGKGMYKSTDAGKTWTNIGLKDERYISQIIVDPKSPDVVLVSARDYFGAGPARGIFKTTDGGKTWNRVFFKDEKTSVVEMAAAPDDPKLIYAATYNLQIDPDFRRALGSESLIYKSTDAGATWQLLSGTGLPETGRGTIGLAVAPTTGGKRVYAIINSGLFRSDDGGANWYRSTKDPRITGSTFFGKIYVDPRNPDLVYVMQTSMYRSIDGGKSFESYKGAPSGEDQHVLWIDPADTERMILGSDQGAIVSVDGGHTWTDWFTQPTGQFYHVTTDKAFPYRLYAAQQDSGSVAVLSRSDFGQITYRDWFSTGAFESGYIAPDPLNSNLIYSVGWYGSVFRLDRTTGQIATVFGPGAKYRYTWETPLVFSPRDPKTMYLGMQYVMKTSDGAQTWQEISPDLTSKNPRPNDQGVIEAISPSAAAPGEIWVGTSTGLVQLTRDDGAHWTNVTPGELPGRSEVRLIETSAVDPETAYVIAATFGDTHPNIFRTHDAGKSWQKIVNGLPDTAIARVVREDPERKGLVYAGTETGVYVSFDGGDHWQSLQFDLPTTSVRDLNVHGSDLVVATYGRGLWILDDLTPLRQVGAEMTSGNAYLFKPATAVRARWDNHPDTPLSADLPAGENPPDGAIIYYYQKHMARVTLEIRDPRGNVVSRYSNAFPALDNGLRNVPDYWFEKPAMLSNSEGLNRVVWNMQWPAPNTLTYNFRGRHIDYIEYTLPDHAIAGKTPMNQPPGPLVVPGTYEVILTVDSSTYRQPLVVQLDPRVHVSQADLEAQLDVARMIDAWMDSSYHSYNEVGALRTALAADQKALPANPQTKELSDALQALDKELSEIQDGTNTAPGFGAINRDVARFVTMIQSGDIRPAKSIIENATPSCVALQNDLARWRKINSETLPGVNQILKQNKLALLPVVVSDKDPRCPN
ncbi:MAG: hypothetical protein QOG23_1658 [Blastocatellia bacterium]|jgi:photosystem II stability/assembly factor-like uncharacterized protein|nr:hypothetical protein [Blastocatellia bacterium]